MHWLIAIVVGITLLLSVGDSAAQGPPPQERFVYSVKFLCGVSKRAAQQDPLATGVYHTEINIQRADPGAAGEAKVSVQPVLAGSMFGFGGEVGDRFEMSFRGQEVRMVDCFNIGGLLETANVFGDPPVIGFLQIFSLSPLAVVGVYSAQLCESPTHAPWLVPPRGRGRPVQGCDGEVALDVVPYQPSAITQTDPGQEPPG